MKIKLTKIERKVLEHSEGGCMCESYYNYQCSKCKQIADGFGSKNSKVFDRFENDGYIFQRDGYGAWELTAAGQSLLRSVRNEK